MTENWDWPPEPKSTPPAGAGGAAQPFGAAPQHPAGGPPAGGGPERPTGPHPRGDTPYSLGGDDGPRMVPATAAAAGGPSKSEENDDAIDAEFEVKK